MDNIVLSSHLGASTKEAQRKTSIEMANIIRDYLLKGDFSNAVNTQEIEREEAEQLYSLFLRHKDKPGVFGKISKILGDYGINIRENPSNAIQIEGKKTGYAATVYLTNQPVSEEILEKLRQVEEVYSVKV